MIDNREGVRAVQLTPIAEIGYSWPSNAEVPCRHCPALAGNTRTQVVYTSNCMIGGLLVVGGAPGRVEDELGEGFVGAAGHTLDRLLRKQGIERKDYGRAYVCRCIPVNSTGGNRKLSAAEITNCIPYLATLIKEMRPKVILAVGGKATEVFCGKAPLYKLIGTREKANDWTARFGAFCAHQQLQPVLGYAQYVVPVPHTSSRAWKETTTRQVQIAAQLMKR